MAIRSTFLRHSLPILVALLLALIGCLIGARAEAGADHDSRHAPPGTSEVLTLEEAAAFLRVSPEEIAELARQGRVPGRQIGEKWRFSRKALLEWLGGHDTVSGSAGLTRPTSRSLVPEEGAPPLEGSGHGQPQEFHLAGNTLEESALPRVAGRGGRPVEGNAGPAAPSVQEPAPVGDKPDLATAEEIFLRKQQVLLRPYQLTLELDGFYTKSEQDGFSVIPIGSNRQIAFFEGDRDSFTSIYTARLGLPRDLQAFVSIPLFHDEDSVTSAVPDSSTTEETSTSETEFGDLALGMRRTVLRAGLGYPDVILSATGQIPTNQSSFGIGGGVALVKHLDPAVLFADADYQHIFSREFDDVTRLLPENIVSTELGYALSLNDTLSISTSLSGTFTTRTTFDDPALPTLPARERFSLALSLTALLTERLYVEPSVSFALNGPRAVSVGVSLPYTFDAASLFARSQSQPP